MSTYFAILTAVGEAKRANAETLGTIVQITHMAVGDGNGATPVPNRLQTALVNEVRRAPINTLDNNPSDASQIIVEQVIPENVGGWWIREIGLYDADGDLVAVANAPATYKPALAEGSGRTQVVRMVLIWGSSAAIQLKIDPAVVLATRGYVDAEIIEVMQAFAPLAAHLLRDDNPHNTTKNQVGLGNVENYGLASQEEAEEEESPVNNKYMTPLRVWQAIAKAWKTATAAEVQAGTDTSKAVTPAGLSSRTATETRTGLVELATAAEAQAFAADKVIDGAKLAAALQGSNQLLAASGYQKLPGGLILQWGSVSAGTGGAGTAITFPVAYPSACRSVATGCDQSTVGVIEVCGPYNITASGFTIVASSSPSTGGTWDTSTARQCWWMAIGY